MKILFVFPSGLNDNREPLKFRKSVIPSLTLGILDALTPKNHSVRILDDFVEQIDFTNEYDLVGITAMTFQAPRAYQIADGFRSKGVKVILGGVHVSALPEEAKQHADSVVIGEVDDIWEGILDDCENNNLKEFYKAEKFPDVNNSVIPKWDNFNMNNYVKVKGKPFIPLFTSRGCPMGCKFCSVTNFFGKDFRTKPISKVLKEIENADVHYYYFNDDNVAYNTDYSRELFKAIAKTGKKIKWASQISTLVLKNPDVIELAAKSGCVELLVGFESISSNALKSVNKNFNKVEHYEELIARMNKVGIAVLSTFIFGFDPDMPEQFEMTLKFLKKNKVARTAFYILTPLPGTKIFKELQEQGRILHYDWAKYTTNEPVIELKNFSHQQIIKLRADAYKKFYSLKNIIGNSWYTTANMQSGNRISNFFETLIYLWIYRTLTTTTPIEGGITPLNL